MRRCCVFRVGEMPGVSRQHRGSEARSQALQWPSKTRARGGASQEGPWPGSLTRASALRESRSLHLRTWFLQQVLCCSDTSYKAMKGGNTGTHSETEAALNCSRKPQQGSSQDMRPSGTPHHRLTLRAVDHPHVLRPPPGRALHLASRVCDKFPEGKVWATAAPEGQGHCGLLGSLC